MLSRRGLLVGVAGLVAAAGTWSMWTGFRPWLRSEIGKAFGEAIAAQPDTAQFIADFVVYFEEVKGRSATQAEIYFRIKPLLFSKYASEEAGLRALLIDKFVHSTNVIKLAESGGDFEYTGIFAPYLAPCTNQLGAYT